MEEQNPTEEMTNPPAEAKAEAEHPPDPQPVSSPKAESPPEEDQPVAETEEPAKVEAGEEAPPQTGFGQMLGIKPIQEQEQTE